MQRYAPERRSDRSRPYGNHDLNAVFQRFWQSVLDLALRDDLADWPVSLEMRRDGDWATYYAPFDHVNTSARIVLVGITPGLQQAGNALRSLQQELRRGTPDPQALEVAKRHASFSGPMRQNLVDLLDHIGIPRLLGLSSAAQLFSDRSDLVHYTSALRYPVTLKGKNYGGSPSITATRYTRDELHWVSDEVRTLSSAIFVPLGPAATDALGEVGRASGIPEERFLNGLPHPSGANAERIAYFCGRKARELLSAKTDPARLDAARVRLIEQVNRLQGAQ